MRNDRELATADHSTWDATAKEHICMHVNPSCYTTASQLQVCFATDAAPTPNLLDCQSARKLKEGGG
eukprot:747081-Pleurochrysis_carterae.AAC.4